MDKTPSELGFVYDAGGLDKWVLFKCTEVGTDYSDGRMSDCCILRAECIGLSFCRAECRNVAFIWSSFDLCDFRNANLTGADFRCSVFKRCAFNGAILRLAELRGAEFVACEFEDADVEGARVGYLQSLRLGWSEKQKKQAARSLLGPLGVKAPPGG